jgi:hypothetical protein
MNKTIIKMLAGSICVSAMVYLIWGYQPRVNIVTEDTAASSMVPEENSLPTASVSSHDIDGVQAFIDTLSNKMKDQHAHEIESVLVQLSMADFRQFVLEQFPVKGESVFQQIMRTAFPAYAESIFAVLANMRLYNDWHVGMLLTLNDMNPLTRKGTLWGKRRDIFGELAQQIWQQELDSEEANRKNVQETLALLHKASHLSMTERLYILTDNINQLYGDEHSNLLISKGMVADIYFHLDSVQHDLKNMVETERSDALAASRRQLGFTDKNIEEMALQDKAKEIRWKNGYEYMSARDQLINLYKGAELDGKLTDLREKHFKHEAATIKKEEKTDFYRYNRPRLYGSN